MAIIFYKKITDTKGEIERIVYDTSLLSESQLLEGIEIATINPPEYKIGKSSIQYVDPTNKIVFYEYIDRPLTTEEKLQQIEDSKKTAEEKYKEIDLSTSPLTVVQDAKIAWLVEEWQRAVQSDFTSSLIGSDGKPIIFGYSQFDQDNYKKQGVLVSLDSTLDSIPIGTVSHGVITLTRDEFIQFIKDCNAHEMPIYNKFDDLRRQVMACKENDKVDLIQWT